MMLIGGDYNVNLVQRYDGSLQEVLKLTMLNQEEIFRKQVSTTESMKNKCLHDTGNSCLKLHRTCLDLELPASHCNDNVDEDFLREQNVYSTAKGSFKMEHDFHYETVSSVEELRLSLRINRETWQKGICRPTWEDKVFCSPSRFVIDLEGLNEASSNGRRETSAGVNQCHRDISGYDMLARGKLSDSHEVGLLDLNRSLLDESSFQSIALGTSYPSTSTVSCASQRTDVEYRNPTALNWREPKSDCFNESSMLLRPDTEFLNLMASKNKNDCQLNGATTLCDTHIESIGGPSKNTEPKNVDSPAILSDGNESIPPIPEMNGEKTKEDMPSSHLDTSQEPVEGTDSNKSPISWKSDGIAEDISSNRNTTQCGSTTRKLNCSPMKNAFPNSESSQVARKLFQDNVECSGDSHLKSQFLDQVKGEAAEHDKTVKRGAVSLIYFSLQCLAGDQNCIPCPNNGKRDVTQCSSDSYESLVLKQPESNVDEYCVSSAAPFDVNGLNEMDYAKKLKRGRRMKDFQKEILPSLSSLSRQEICEDIRILQGAIRSREYKKYRAKNDCRDDYLAPVRGRRPRGKRYYS
ncbi:uncharacterized protein LOC111382183 isoform X2 [Olea europaea var. sylvestris]|uniref:uncharacterized protein LOC111382183 isoform X2 n=1 Tax=Olea europaea var. sylvestris TaxID=158386 RepID=UPI000C1CD888|nr:uncharacterized protein LOC111382183 isoform X2 [Olea europaea var. sylvestris]